MPSRRRPLGGLLLGVLALAAGACGALGADPTPTPVTQIAFASNRTGGVFRVFLLDQKEGLDQEGSVPEVVPLTDYPMNVLSPVWSPVRQQFAVTVRLEDGRTVIGIMNADGSDLTIPEMDPNWAYGQPTWSPDGRFLAFNAIRGEIANVFLLGVDTQEVVRLTDGLGENLVGPWSPDGSRLLFTSRRDGGLAIYSMDSGGGDVQRLTDPSYDSGTPAWSPDGTRIALTSNRDGALEIYAMNPDGTDVVNLTNHPSADLFPKWSPDGTKLLFLSDRNLSLDIFVMDADGSNQVNLTQTPEARESISGDYEWSPDGTKILFHSERDGPVDVFVMDADGSNPVNLTKSQTLDYGATWVWTRE